MQTSELDESVARIERALAKLEVHRDRLTAAPRARAGNGDDIELLRDAIDEAIGSIDRILADEERDHG